MPDEIDTSAILSKFERLVSEPVRKGLIAPKTREVSENLASILSERFNFDLTEKNEFQSIEGMIQLSNELMKRTSTPIEILMATFLPAVKKEHYGHPLYCERGLFNKFGMELARSAVSSGAAICLAENSGYFAGVSVHRFSIGSDEPQYSLPVANDIWTAGDLDDSYLEDYGADQLHFVLFETILSDPVLAAKLSFKPFAHRVPREDRLEASAKPGGFAKLDAPYVKRGRKMIELGEVSSPHATAKILAEEMWKRRSESKDKSWPGASEDAITARLGRQLRKAE